MDNYYFVYKNAEGEWHSASNPMFIASHQHCRAIPKYVVSEDLGYKLLSDLLYDINHYSKEKLTSKQIQILIEFCVYVD